MSMLQSFRNASKSWIGKAVVFVLFGLLIVSFAVWGIGDIFRGGVRTTVATVGSVEISADQVRTAYQNEVQRVTRQLRQSITPERARALGLETRVVTRLVTDATLSETAKRLGLAVSDDLVARSVRDDPSFKDSSGQFNHANFTEILRSAGMTEPQFIAEQRNAVARLQLAEAIGADMRVPASARDLAHRYGAERRTVSHFVLPPAAAGEIPAPTNEQLQAFFEPRKAAYRAPEYRAIQVVALTPESVAKPQDVSDPDAQRRYEEVKGQRFGTPERRTIQQIPFPTTEEAAAAAQRLPQGQTFEQLAAERNVAAADLELGVFSKAEMIDRAVADAAFALAQGDVSAPVQGRFGPVLLRVTTIQLEQVRPFAEVADEVKRELALERARAGLDTVHDRIEDQRAGAKPLAEIAKEMNLPLFVSPPVDRAGRDKSAQPVAALPEQDVLLPAAFASDIGVDNEALRTRSGGWVWYDVTAIEPARDKTLEEVRDQVAAQWREEEVASRLAERARALTEKLDGGAAIETLAAEAGLAAETTSDVARSTTSPVLTQPVVSRIFSTQVGKAGSAPGSDSGRVVFKVTDATVPPLVGSSRETEQLVDQLRIFVTEDLISSFIAQKQRELGVTIDQTVLRRAIGGET
jgi:peptidyl-prolyl cis-trans isomerase D